MKVYNRKNKDAPDGSVYVGRPSKWGNPFHISKYCTREQAVQKYRDTLGKRDKIEIRRELKGKNLICWCSPEPCHADVLLEIANSDDQT